MDRKKEPYIRGLISSVFNRPNRTGFFFDEVSSRLEDRLEFINLLPSSILCLGVGNNSIADRYPKARSLVYADVSSARLRFWERPKKSSWFARDRVTYAEVSQLAMPFRPRSFQLIYSNLMFPLLFGLDDLRDHIRILSSLLQPGGLLIFSTLGPSTLGELNADQAGRTFRVNDAIDLHEIGDMLVAEGLADPVMEMEELTLTYKNLLSLLRDLKNHGSYAKEPLREKGLMGKKKFAELSGVFSEVCRETPKATFELIIGHAWRPNQGLQMSDGKTIPIKAI